MKPLFNRIAQGASKNATFRAISLWARNAKQARALARLADLNAFERRVLSQNGEDGIIAELFTRIPNNRFFVEIGVEDGEQCNTALLARYYGWKGLMIEANAGMFQRLKTRYELVPVNVLNLLVSRENIAQTLEGVDVPKTLDLLCIDIDGNDYYVWEALGAYCASVVVIEYNAAFGATASKTIAYDPEFAWDKSRFYGASLTALAKLGDRLGYGLIGTDRRGINAFFVRRDLLGICGFPEKSPREVWRRNVLLGLLPEGSGRIYEV
jgi:hypothetical protein